MENIEKIIREMSEEDRILLIRLLRNLRDTEDTEVLLPSCDSEDS